MKSIIDYTYTDAGNYHTFSSVIIDGKFTLEEANEIFDCCNDTEQHFFLPEQVGFPENRDDKVNLELDHIWFSLDTIRVWDGKEAGNNITELEMTTKDVVEKFRQAKGRWDEAKAVERLLNLAAENEEDDDDGHYTPSSTNRDYSPSNPGDAPVMSIHDFI